MTTVSGSIDRSALALAALPFGDGSGLSIYLDGLKPGRRKWRRATVDSPFLKGNYETAAVLDQTDDAEFRFRIRKPTEGAVKTMAADLVDAVEQRTWDLQITVGSTDWPLLTCTRADTELIFDVAHVRGFAATLFVYTTHKPSSGAL